MSDELPEGWAHATLGELLANGLFADGDWVESKDQDPRGDVRLIQLADVGDGKFRNRSARFLTSAKAKELCCTALERNDVLIARMPEPLGRACMFPGDQKQCVTVVDVCVARPSPGTTEAKWLMHAVNAPQFRGLMEEFERGTTRKRISRSNLGGLTLALPPLAEQRRLVAKVEALLTRVGAARERLEKVLLILKRFRQAVLAAACSGELTREWRESHPAHQAAGLLLAEIAKRRTDLRLPTANRPIPHEGIEIPDGELPDSWAWCMVGQIADVRLGGTPPRNEPSCWNGTVPWVSSGEVANCRISNTSEQITKKGLDNSNAKLYPAGSVLIAMIGEGKTRGQSAILDIEASTNQNAAGLIFDVGMINAEYVWYWALQEYVKNRDEGRGGNQPALNCAKVRALPVPLPPVEEQAEIVRTLKATLALADAIERRVRTASRMADILPQGILSKAFSGELVLTEAELAQTEGREYESANQLLGRIKAEREAQEPVKAGKRKKQRSKLKSLPRLQRSQGGRRDDRALSRDNRTDN